MPKKKKESKLGLILGSLVIAVCLWVYIIGEESVEVAKKVPLVIRTAEGITVANRLRETVIVRLDVPRNLMAILDSQPLEVIHEIADVKEFGKYSFDLTAKDVRRPSSIIKVLQIIPERVVVTLDAVINKRVPIVANLVNEPAAGFKIDREHIQIDPNAALISGARSVLEKMEFVRTEPIDVIGRIRSFRKKVILEDQKDYQVLNNSLVDVFVPIKEEFTLMTYAGISIHVLQGSRRRFEVTLTPETVDLSLRGSLKAMESIKKENILAYVKVVGLTPGKYQLPLQTNLPTDVFMENANPVVEVSIKDSEAPLALPRAVIAEVETAGR